MGSYRFILSSLVVLFHTGSISTPSGYSAVFGFYLLSGYLIPLAIERNYGLDTGGIARYYGNRALRILPLYIFFLVLTQIVAFWHGGTSFYFNDKLVHVIPGTADGDPINLINEFFLGISPNTIQSNPVYALNGFPKTVPQAWSLVVEINFYILAPFFLLAIRLNNLVGRIAAFCVLLSSLAFCLYTFHIGLDFGTYRYRSTFGSFFIFMLGFLIYLLHDRIPCPFHSKIILAVLVALYLTFVIFVNQRTLIESQIYCALALQFFITISAINIIGDEGRLDSWLGALSYGIFVGHFFVALLMAIATSDHTSWSYFRGILGDYGSIRFGAWCLVFSAIMAQLCHALIEHPINHIRNKLRGNKNTVVNQTPFSENGGTVEFQTPQCGPKI